jgi:hypothetical protein
MGTQLCHSLKGGHHLTSLWWLLVGFHISEDLPGGGGTSQSSLLSFFLSQLGAAVFAPLAVVIWTVLEPVDAMPLCNWFSNVGLAFHAQVPSHLSVLTIPFYELWNQSASVLWRVFISTFTSHLPTVSFSGNVFVGLWNQRNSDLMEELGSISRFCFLQLAAQIWHDLNVCQISPGEGLYIEVFKGDWNMQGTCHLLLEFW